VHLSAPIDICRQRDTDGHYAKADSGDMPLFPGVSSPYEPPLAPDLVLQTDKLPIDQCVERVLGLLQSKQILD
jgi:adenylylsulfate kinase-like enzyme